MATICNTKTMHFFVTLSISLSLIVPLAAPLSFNYPNFSSGDKMITYERAFVENQAIQLAKNNGMVGRATYTAPMLLWNKTSTEVTDFTTHFSFSIDSQNKTAYRDGLAFFLVPQGSRIPTVTKGDSLGLANDDQLLNSSSNPFVAVEFDIFSNNWDPIGDHVGIDINSMKSVSNVTWQSDIRSGTRNDAWISYDSNTHNLSVVFTGFKDNVKVMQYLEHKVDLKFYLPEFVSFGFSAATTGNATTTIHTIHSWEFSSTLEEGVTFQAFLPQPPPTPPDDDSSPTRRRTIKTRRVGRKGKSTLGLAIGLPVAAVVSLVGLISAWLGCGGTKKNAEENGENKNNVAHIEEGMKPINTPQPSN